MSSSSFSFFSPLSLASTYAPWRNSLNRKVNIGIPTIKAIKPSNCLEPMNQVTRNNAVITTTQTANKIRNPLCKEVVTLMSDVVVIPHLIRMQLHREKMKLEKSQICRLVFVLWSLCRSTPLSSISFLKSAHSVCRIIHCSSIDSWSCKCLHYIFSFFKVSRYCP